MLVSYCRVQCQRASSLSLTWQRAGTGARRFRRPTQGALHLRRHPIMHRRTQVRRGVYLFILLPKDLFNKMHACFVNKTMNHHGILVTKNSLFKASMIQRVCEKHIRVQAR